MSYAIYITFRTLFITKYIKKLPSSCGKLAINDDTNSVTAYPLVLSGGRGSIPNALLREAIPLCFTPNGLIGSLLGPIFLAFIH